MELYNVAFWEIGSYSTGHLIDLHINRSYSIAYRARRKSNPPWRILYLWNYCSGFFHQIYSVYRGGFRPHILCNFY